MPSEMPAKVFLQHLQQSVRGNLKKHELSQGLGVPHAREHQNILSRPPTDDAVERGAQLVTNAAHEAPLLLNDIIELVHKPLVVARLDLAHDALAPRLHRFEAAEHEAAAEHNLSAKAWGVDHHDIVCIRAAV